MILPVPAARIGRPVACVTITIELVTLIALVFFPQFRGHLPSGGWGAAAVAAIGIAGDVLYLHSIRGRS